MEQVVVRTRLDLAHGATEKHVRFFLAMLSACVTNASLASSQQGQRERGEREQSIRDLRKPGQRIQLSALGRKKRTPTGIAKEENIWDSPVQIISLALGHAGGLKPSEKKPKQTIFRLPPLTNSVLMFMRSAVVPTYNENCCIILHMLKYVPASKWEDDRVYLGYQES